MTSSPHSSEYRVVRGFLRVSWESEAQGGAFVLLTLVCNITFNHLFIKSHSRDEIPHAPNAAVDIHITDEFELFLKVSTWFWFESLDDGSNGEVGWYFDLKMYMIFVCVKWMYVERGIFLGGCVEIFSQFLLRVFLDVFSSIPSSPYYVVFNLISDVIQASYSHDYSVPRGNTPLVRWHSSPHSRRRGGGSCGVSC